MANENLPADVQKHALDLLIAVKQARAAAPPPQHQAAGGAAFLEMTAEALVATAHFIVAAAATAPNQEVQDAVRTLAEQGRAAHERTSLDDLVELRRKVVS